MNAAAAERFPDPEMLLEERYGSNDDVMIVRFRIKRNGRWKAEQGTRQQMTVRAREIARDDRYDRMRFEFVPASVAQIPEELGGGVVDFTDDRCPECGEPSNCCTDWCSLTRSSR